MPTKKHSKSRKNKYNSTDYILEFNEDETSSYYGFVYKSNRTRFGLLVCSKAYFIGQFKKDVINGAGRLTHNKKYNYVGEFDRGVREGVGRMTTRSWEYIGQFEKHRLRGFGTKVSLKNGDKSEGYFRGEKLEGFGVMTFGEGQGGPENATQLVGNFQSGLLNGYCRIDSHGEKYEGDCLDGEMHGLGSLQTSTITYDGYWTKDKMGPFGSLKDVNDRWEYKGFLDQGRKSGLGWFYDSVKDSTYLGKFENEEYEGFGQLISPGSEYTGFFSKGQRQGLGYLVEDNRSYFGFWEHGQRVGLGIIDEDSSRAYCEWHENQKNGLVYVEIDTDQGEVKEQLWNYENGKQIERLELDEHEIDAFLESFKIINIDNFLKKTDKKLAEFEAEINKFWKEFETRKADKQSEKDELDQQYDQLQDQLEVVKQRYDEVEEAVMMGENILIQACKKKNRDLHVIFNEFEDEAEGIPIDISQLPPGVEIPLRDWKKVREKLIEENQIPDKKMLTKSKKIKSPSKQKVRSSKRTIKKKEREEERPKKITMRKKSKAENHQEVVRNRRISREERLRAERDQQSPVKSRRSRDNSSSRRRKDGQREEAYQRDPYAENRSPGKSRRSREMNSPPKPPRGPSRDQKDRRYPREEFKQERERVKRRPSDTDRKEPSRGEFGQEIENQDRGFRKEGDFDQNDNLDKEGEFNQQDNFGQEGEFNQGPTQKKTTKKGTKKGTKKKKKKAKKTKLEKNAELQEEKAEEAANQETKKKTKRKKRKAAKKEAQEEKLLAEEEQENYQSQNDGKKENLENIEEDIDAELSLSSLQKEQDDETLERSFTSQGENIPEEVPREPEETVEVKEEAKKEKKKKKRQKIERTRDKTKMRNRKDKMIHKSGREGANDQEGTDGSPFKKKQDAEDIGDFGIVELIRKPKNGKNKQKDPEMTQVYIDQFYKNEDLHKEHFDGIVNDEDHILDVPQYSKVKEHDHLHHEADLLASFLEDYLQ